MTAPLPLAEWPDPSQYRIVTYAAIVPSTVVVNPKGTAPTTPEMFVLTIDASRPGKMPPGEELVREVLCIPVGLARQIATAFASELRPPSD